MDYVLKSGSHRRWEGSKKDGKYVVYKAGDVIKNVTPDELKAHRKRLSRSIREEVTTPPSLTKEETAKYDEIADMKVSDVVSIINDLEEVDEVKLLMTAELRGRSRKGVISAANDRLEDLGDVNEQDDDDDDDNN